MKKMALYIYRPKVLRGTWNQRNDH